MGHTKIIRKTIKRNLNETIKDKTDLFLLNLSNLLYSIFGFIWITITFSFKYFNKKGFITMKSTHCGAAISTISTYIALMILFRPSCTIVGHRPPSKLSSSSCSVLFLTPFVYGPHRIILIQHAFLFGLSKKYLTSFFTSPFSLMFRMFVL